MSALAYPDGVDCAWLASDQAGQLGMFITAGHGPIPEAVLAGDFGDVEDLALRLPISSKATVLKKVPRPDSFLAMAERGFYVFDWSNVDRSDAAALDAYELVAVPDRPAAIGSLPRQLQNAANAAAVKQVRFSTGRPIDVAAQ